MPLTEEQLGAVRSIDKHVLVSAGAGSGKTSVLVERYLEVLRRHDDAEVGDIIAVTFTKKAAEEMRTRLKEGLKELAANSSSDSEAERWNKCLIEIESSRIGTIHSLCDFLLKTRSTEAAVDPRFELLDDLERAQLLDESIRSAIGMVLDEPEAASNQLLEFPPEQITEMIKQLLSSSLKFQEAREVILGRAQGTRDSARSSYAADELSCLREFASKFTERTYMQAVANMLSHKAFKLNCRYILDQDWPEPDSALGIGQNLMRTLLYRVIDTQGSDYEALEQLRDFRIPRCQNPESGTLKEAMKAVRFEAKKVKLCPHLTDADEKAFAVITALVHVAEASKARYEEGKKQSQKLDFDDLIARTATLVEQGNRAVSLKNMRALLVDEFQDTNKIQARMLTALASAAPNSRMFLIGDDKQSIYKFQGADVGTFNFCKSVIAALSLPEHNRSATEHWPVLSGEGALRSLSMSFRSHPEIVEFVNVLFHKLFDATEDSEAYRSRFQALNAARPTNEDGRQRVEVVTFAMPEEETSDELDEQVELRSRPGLSTSQAEAKVLARYIQDALTSGLTVFDRNGEERPARYGDFAVLLQANGDFAVIESALAEVDIPFVSFAGSGYLDRQEIWDLENLLKWILAPQDGHALLAVLRSPICGLSDDLIHDLKTKQGSSLWGALRKASLESPEPVVLRAVALLREFLNRSGELSPDQLLRYILRRSALDAILCSIPGGKQRSRNVWKFVDLAARYNHLGLRGFLDSLQAMRDNGVKNLTDAPLTADNAVKIMTVHKSKGLEFGVVVLPRLNRKVHGATRKLLIGKEYGIAIDPTRDANESKPSFFKAVDALNRMLDEEEKKRLLYVALTRARDHLTLLLPAKSSTSVSFSKWLEEGLELDDLSCTFDTAEERRIASGGRTARFIIRSVDVPEEIRIESKPDADSSINPVDLNLTLIEPVGRPSNDLPDVPWQSLERVTPGNDGASIHATVMGNYFHLLMDRMSHTLQPPSEELMRDLLFTNQVSVIHSDLQNLLLEEGRKLLEIFASSPLFSIMKEAKTLIHETAYFTVSNGIMQDERRPDLLVEDKHGNWSIIDYKTDDLKHKEISKQAKTHHAQLVGYADDFFKITNIEPRTYLYFARLGVLHEVNARQPVQLSLL